MGAKEKKKQQKSKSQERKQVPEKPAPAPQPTKPGFFRKLLCVIFYGCFLAVLTESFWKLTKPRDDLYVFRFGRKVGEAGLWIDSKLDKQISSYRDIKEYAKPYGALAHDLLKVGINVHDNARSAFSGYVDEKYPVVVASIDSYAPGLIDNTQVLFNKTVVNTVHYYETSVNYLQKQVFVGQLSPENIQRAVVRAYNTTSGKAIEYYHWVYEKVQTSIK